MQVARPLPSDWEPRLRAVLPAPLAGDPLTPIGAGLDFWGIRVGSERLLRVPQHGAAAATIEREAPMLAALAPLLPVPIPEPLGVARNPIGPGNLGIYTFVTGEVLDDETWQHRGLLSEANAATVAAIVAAISAFPVERARQLGIGTEHYRVGPLGETQRVEREVAAELPDPLARVLMERWQRFAGPMRSPDDVAALHGDLSLDHLLVDPATGAVCGLIDFGDLALGDPDAEFTYLWADAGPEFVTAVLANLGRPLTAELMAKLEFLALADEVADVLWAVQTGDATLRAESLALVSTRLQSAILRP